MVVTDVSGQNIGPIFKAEAVLFDCLTVGDVSDRLSRNVGKKLTFYAAEKCQKSAEFICIAAGVWEKQGGVSEAKC